MARLSHYLEYLAAGAGTGLARLMSARTADAFGAALGSAAHAILASRRHIAFDNLKLALGDSLTDDEIKAVTRRVFRNIGRTVVEFARFRRIRPDGVRKIVVGTGEHHFERVLKEGKGAVLVTGHFGNWELLGSWVSTLGYPVDLLVGTQHNVKVDRMLIGFRQEMGVGIIPLKTALKGVFKALRAGRMVALVADQHDPTGGLVIDFFGRKAATPRGPAAFAVRAGCPILTAVLRRERYDRHVVLFGEPIYPPHSGDDEADIRDMTLAYTRFFEDSIRRYPDQWMWTHRRWKL
jgi:KDO2-lipid IV(A) lauroyltransferase